MLKKAGIITVGVSAALVAASPMAFAGDSTEGASDSGGHGHHQSHGDNDKGHGHGHHKGHGGKGWGNTSCASESGDVKGNDTKGILALGPILDGNSGQIASCNSFLNNNFSGNDVHVANHVLSL